MDLLISFVLFMAAMFLSLTCDVSMIFPLLVGLLAFSVAALHRKFSVSNVVRMCLAGMKESMVVAVIMLLIGCLTSLWRQSGTIAYFTYHGVRLIPSQIFVLAAFILSGLMSYALGTSFGVAATMGVILLTIARSSGVSTALVGGAVMSGLYIGDRGSPAASSASLVANETRTSLTRNIRLMFPSALLPMILCALLYLFLSLFSRPDQVNTELLTAFSEEYNLSAWCLAPTLLLLVLAFAGMKIKYVMLVDIAFSIAVTLILQKAHLGEVLRMTMMGYMPHSAQLAPILSGGGLVSMLEVVALLFLSSGCAGIFEGTGMLSGIEGALKRLSGQIGRFPTMIIASLGVCAVFCNQTIGIIMCRQCMAGNYAQSDEGRTELMLDIENSVVVLAGLVPWCIASSVPLRTMGCGFSALPFAAYLYLLPLCWMFKLRLKRRTTA